MKTSKPISTISYNTTPFLIHTLDMLKYLKIISYYEFICHLPDKEDKKKHTHLYIEPNKVIDTEVFSNYFVEYTFLKCFKFNKTFKPFHKKYFLNFTNLKSKYRYSSKLKPLKCIHFQSSKFGDWYWYALHDKDYLKAKMLTRNTFYTDADIYSCDLQTHFYKVAENPLINYAQMSDVALRDYVFHCVKNGYSLAYLLNTCNVPLGKVQSVIHFFNALSPVYSPKTEQKYILQNVQKVHKSQVINQLNNISSGKVEPVFNGTIEEYVNYDEIF